MEAFSLKRRYVRAPYCSQNLKKKHPDVVEDFLLLWKEEEVRLLVEVQLLAESVKHLVSYFEKVSVE